MARYKTFAAAICGVAAITAGVAIAKSDAPMGATLTRPPAISEDEHARTIGALVPPKRKRPVVAVLAHNEGAETTDFLVPFAVLTRSDVADVLAVAPSEGAIELQPTLTVRAQASTARFDSKYPDGADYVVVPALRHPNDPAIIAWIQAQAAKGATIVGICSGVRVLSNAGLLKGRNATGYWADIDELRAENPTMTWVRDRRYVADRGVATTTGITASVPMSLAIVEAIAGKARANDLARDLGASGWNGEHDSDAFRSRGWDHWVAVRNRLAASGGYRFGVPVKDGVDDIALAFTADAYTRVYRGRTAAIASSARPVRTRHGLLLVPDQSAKADVKRMLPAPPLRRPAGALDAALSDIGEKYGADTADYIAQQMEYPRGSLSH